MHSVQISISDGQSINIPICAVDCEILTNSQDEIDIASKCFSAALVRTLQHHTRFFSSLTLKNQWYIKDQTGNSAALAGLLRWRSEPDFRDYKFRENGFRKAKYTKVTKHAQGAGGSQ